MNIMLCPIKVNSNTIELTAQTDRFFIKKKKSQRKVVCGLVARGLRLQLQLQCTLLVIALRLTL